MLAKGHTPFKKVIAILLLGLMGMIHAEKAFHTHHEESNRLAKEVIHSVGSTGCTICDFQLAGDADAPALQSSLPEQNFHGRYFAAVTSSYHFIYYGDHTNKGPPAC